jgi:hypothetical protein
MSSYLDSAIFAIHADQFGFPDIANYMIRYEGYNPSQDEKLFEEICEVKPDQSRALVGMEGSRENKNIINCNLKDYNCYS